MDRVNFLLLSLPRSGSRMLCDLLNSHPDIACEHELYGDPDKRSDYRGALDNLSDKYGKPVAVGHAQYGQLHSSMLIDKIKRLLLVREDKLRGAISAMLMGVPRANGLFRLESWQVRQLQDERALHTAIMRPHADEVVTYEELTGGEAIVELAETQARRLCAFFGVTYHPLTTTVRKNYPKLPENLEELRRA